MVVQREPGARGSCSCGHCQHICPIEKELFHGTYPRSALLRRRAGSWPEGGCLFACSQQATITPTVTMRIRQIYFTTVHHNVAVFHDLWLYNSLFESTIWSWFQRSALVPLPDYSLAKRHKMAVGAECWKAVSGSHFNRARLGQKNNSRLTTYWTMKIKRGKYSAKLTFLRI